MPLAPPPARAGALEQFPAERLGGRSLYRLWRPIAPDGSTRATPWWFGSTDADAGPGTGMRFDLPPPDGTCSLTTTPVAAVLEGLQAFLTNLPRAELDARRVATVSAPADAPRAAKLTARAAAGQGVTVALWATADRVVTRAWARAFRRDGWWALFVGAQHDPTGRGRAIALFDRAGEREPTYGGPWSWTSGPVPESVVAQLTRFGITARAPAELTFVTPPELT